MQTWLLEVSRARRELRRRRPVPALRRLQRARSLAPARVTGVNHATHRVSATTLAGTMRRELSDLHCCMAMSFRRAGMRNRALAGWVESARLVKRGTARRRISRQVNEYGMARQPTAELDDQHAFYGVQFARYLRSKKSHSLGTHAEVDMVVELLEEHWLGIVEGGILDSLTTSERLTLFRETRVVFPFLSVPGEMKTRDLAVDFGNGRRLEPNDRCYCGSGLPLNLCHERIPGIDEVLTGKF